MYHCQVLMGSCEDGLARVGYAPDALQVITIDKQGFFALYRASDTALLATKRVCTENLVALRQCGPDVYAIATDRAVTIWRIRRELPYNVFRGGHSAAVISLYACSGGLVCFHTWHAPPWPKCCTGQVPPHYG